MKHLILLIAFSFGAFSYETDRYVGLYLTSLATYASGTALSQQELQTFRDDLKRKIISKRMTQDLLSGVEFFKSKKDRYPNIYKALVLEEKAMNPEFGEMKTQLKIQTQIDRAWKRSHRELIEYTKNHLRVKDAYTKSMYHPFSGTRSLPKRLKIGALAMLATTIYVHLQELDLSQEDELLLNDTIEEIPAELIND